MNKTSFNMHIRLAEFQILRSCLKMFSMYYLCIAYVCFGSLQIHFYRSKLSIQKKQMEKETFT